MKLMKLLPTLLLATLPFKSVAEDKLDMYTINGLITPDTLTQIEVAFTKYDIKVVQLVSGGGDLYTALNIGFLIHNKGLTTYVPKGYACASACGYIFLGGKYRILRGSIGMHEFSTDGIGYSSMTTIDKLNNTYAMLAISNYLGIVGVSQDFLVDSIKTPSDDMNWVEDVGVLNNYILKGYLISE